MSLDERLRVHYSYRSAQLGQTPHDLHGVQQRGRQRRRNARVMGIAASVVVLVVAAGTYFAITSDSGANDVETTPIEVPEPQPPPPGAEESGLGSFEWTLIEGADAEFPPVEWSWPAMGFNGSDFYQWVSCEQFRGADDPVVPSELWSSNDGFNWSRAPMPCDTSVAGVADSLVMSPFPGDPLLSTDAENWTPLFADPETAPGGLVWEVDDPRILFDMTSPWNIGGFAPTGWLFEFEDGVSAIQVNRAGGRPDGPLVTWDTLHSADGQEWTPLEHPEFVQHGYDSTDGSTHNSFAHQDGTAIVVFHNGTEYGMWRSDDGVVWTDVTPETLTSGGVWAAGDVWLQGLEFFEGIGSSPGFLASADGENWQRVEVPERYRDFSGTVRAAGNKIFVFGEDLLVGNYTPMQPSTAESNDPVGEDGSSSSSGERSSSGTAPLETDMARTMPPDIASALPGDDRVGALAPGVVSELPASERLDFLFEACDPDCYRDARFMSLDRPGWGSERWPAGRPFYVRHGFVNDGNPLAEDFDVELYITPWGGAHQSDERFELGRTYRFASDYVLRGTSDQCGPTYKTQTESAACEWFIHDFPDGLPAGNYAVWVVWQAPCSAWLELGLTDACDDPGVVTSQFAAGSSVDIGSDEFSFDDENRAQWTVQMIREADPEEFEN